MIGKSLAIEWASFARANTVSPGFIESGLTGDCTEEVKDSLREKTPLGRIGDLKEMKGVYLYLASDASSFTTGTDIVADGGYRLW
jgi:sorbose reductase